MANVVKISAKAPTPMMVPKAAAAFERLREIVRENSGHDFLAKCGDVMRPVSFHSSKDGVANRSWHKTGRAFDYDQTHKALIVVSDSHGGRQYFRTYLRCTDQAGKLGIKRHLKDYRGFSVDAYVFDFTAAAEVQKFERIPAWDGWNKHYNRREFWHYQFNPENLTWDAAMQQLKGKAVPANTPPGENVIYGPNDRGAGVTAIQTALANKGFLDQFQIDGVFGHKTKVAVMKFQLKHDLDADGLVGPLTRAELVK